MTVVLEKIALRIATGRVRTAGLVEFKRDQGPVRRNIRVEGFKWSSDSLRNLAKILWAAQRSHSYAMAAYRMFSRMPSSEFSPDGLLGGLGYIQQVKDMRQGISQAVEMLSSFTDTIHDEVNADHWANEVDKHVNNIVEDAENIKENPEAFVQQEFKEDAESNFENPIAENPDVGNSSNLPGDMNQPNPDELEDSSGDNQSQVATKKPIKTKKSKSLLPTDSSIQKDGKTPAEFVTHTVKPDRGSYAASIAKIINNYPTRTASDHNANSSIPVETLPGPRVDHIGPAGGNEAGNFNDEDWASDDLSGEGLSSGVNNSKYLYEGDDALADGVSGYDDPTDGDESVLRADYVSMATRLSATYSWLPGTTNEKVFDYALRGLTEDDVNWLKAHSDPDPPPSLNFKKQKKKMDHLWDSEVAR